MHGQARKDENGEPSLLLRVEQVKYRKTGPGKSPLGEFYIYDDRVEWISDSDSSDKMVVHLSKIKGQRISPPNKPKVQLQLCMIDEDQATFVFMNSKSSQEQLLQERDTVKELLQQALQKSLSVEEESQQKIGISGGFLSSIVQSDSIGGGIRLNLTTETIQSIFRTYPAVERKHLELVPHELTEQEFWSHFFQSHYFHRERNPAEPSTSSTHDTFADCVKMDEKSMQELLEKGRGNLKRTLDLTSLSEDLGILSDMRSTQLSLRGSSDAKRLLVRRCNYHSERILCTMEEDLGSAFNSQLKKNGFDGLQQDTSENGTFSHEVENSTKNNSAMQERTCDLELESQDLAEFDKPNDQLYCPLSAYNPLQKEQESCILSDQIQLTKYSLTNALETTTSIFEEKNQFTFFDNLAVNFIDPLSAHQSELDSTTSINFTGLSRSDIERIRIVHSGLTELLRHFWQCFPPKIPEMRQKIYRMNETLTRFENEQLAECKKQYGSNYIQHCEEMLALARQRFAAFAATQSLNRD
uniref:BSD domain-containing protein n=1 Tax=Meloidogyne javanica TaxID=6303 RepID=A0A915LHM2_MELJA